MLLVAKTLEFRKLHNYYTTRKLKKLKFSIKIPGYMEEGIWGK